MDDMLVASVLARLERIPLGPAEEQLLFAALEDTETLDQAMGGHAGARPTVPGATPGEATVPAGAYLHTVTVAGFRGIGPAATLEVQPGPGLTVVCGRNGSGKSSFAEALEVLLTGDIRRWAERSAVWKDTWRCLHAPATEITAELLVEGSGPAQLRRTWAAGDTRIGDAVSTVQLLGRSRAPIATLGWDEALVGQRPFLSHAELEALLAEPKALYGQLNSLLGLEDLDAALARVGVARRDADKEAKAAGKDLPGLRQAVSTVDDERATTAVVQLQGKAPDIGALRRLATGGAVVDDGPLRILGQMATLTVPDHATVVAVASELRDAVTGLEAVRTSAVVDATAAAGLLAAALDHTEGQADADCPVCGTPGVIDEAWRARTRREVDRLQTAGREAGDAGRRVDAAVRAARQLLSPVAGWLSGDAGLGPDARAQVGVETDDLVAAWTGWADAPTGDDAGSRLQLADHLLRAHPELADAVERLTAAAREERERRQDRWAPLAQQIVEWCLQAEASAAARTGLDRLKKTEEWLKEAAAELRHQRLRPFADRTAELWRALRQSSNVDLVEVRLAGTANRSHVDFAVTVDGNEATGLGVMSQGEVNALALSVFLPRATMSGSPFRFLIIDDPVQAMDPSKVDGLARVLAEVAIDRQVIVFTHDDRLPDSIRRLDLPAKILEVTRQPGSVVRSDRPVIPAR